MLAPPLAAMVQAVVAVGRGFTAPSGRALDGSGNIFVAVHTTRNDNSIRKIEAATAVVDAAPSPGTLGATVTLTATVTVSA